MTRVKTSCCGHGIEAVSSVPVATRFCHLPCGAVEAYHYYRIHSNYLCLPTLDDVSSCPRLDLWGQTFLPLGGVDKVVRCAFTILGGVEVGHSKHQIRPMDELFSN